MTGRRDPILRPVPLLDLRPTQLTVGIREVKAKRQRWREHKPKKRAELLGRHMIPVVLGPDGEHYVIDHHHLSRALLDEGEKNVLVTVFADLSMVARKSFWTVMDAHRWVYPYDANGKRRDYSDLPKTVAGLKDDPYRSLAGELRRIGGFSKETTPFSEFLWAEFFRQRISRKAVDKDYDAALDRALELARGKDAVYLPGWCGPSDG